MARRLPAACAASIAVASGCFDPNLEEGIACTQDGRCPGELTCTAERICSVRGAGPADASGPADAPDLPRDAATDGGGISLPGWKKLPASAGAPAEPCPGSLVAGNDAVLYVGGESTIEPTSASVGLWRFANGVWEERGSTGPEPRSGHALAVDSTREVAVLFGGEGGDATLLADTWERSGDSWAAPVQNDGFPSPRASHAMVGADGDVLIFGGRGTDDSAPLYADTWRQTDRGWERLRDGDGDDPPAREAHALAHNGDTVLLFGGLDGAGNALDDTWEWNGSSWSERAVDPPPPARAHHAMTYDESAGVIRLAAGIDSSGGDLDDTWEWNGETWTRVVTADLERPRGRAAMAPHPEGGGVMLLDSSCDTWRFDTPERSDQRRLGVGARVHP